MFRIMPGFSLYWPDTVLNVSLSPRHGAGGGDGLQIWRVVGDIVNELLRTAGKG